MAFVTSRLPLLDQAVATIADGRPHGIVQGENTRDAQAPLVFASAQTVVSRGIRLEETHKLIMVDECHAMHAEIKRTVEACSMPKNLAIGLTATPLALSMAETWEGVHQAATTRELFDAGTLIEPLLMHEKLVSMHEAVTTGDGEWSDEEAARIASTMTDEMAAIWWRYSQSIGGEALPTIAFCASVQHAAELAQAMERESGAPIRTVTYKDPMPERRERIAAFKGGSIRGLVTCTALSEGFDAPGAMIALLARPYRRAIIRHLQEIGRVMRTAPGKDGALILDYVGNVARFWHDAVDFYAYGVKSLPTPADPRGREGDEDDEDVEQVERPPAQRPQRCVRCNAIQRDSSRVTCEQCTGELEEVPFDGCQADLRGAAMTTDRWTNVQRLAARQFKGHGDRERAEKWARAVYHALTGEWKRRSDEVDLTRTAPVDVDVRLAVEQNSRKYRETKAAAEAAAVEAGERDDGMIPW